MSIKKERTVTILGEQVKVKFNMAMEVAFEEISGMPFKLKDLDSVKNTLILYTAIIIANNPGSNIDYIRLITEASFGEIKAMRDATIAAMVDAFRTEDEDDEFWAAVREIGEAAVRDTEGQA